MQKLLSWFKEKKNLPIIAGSAVAVIVIAALLVVFLGKKGEPETAGVSPSATVQTTPATSTPGTPAPAAAPPKPAPAAVTLGPTPLLPYRQDPFALIGRKPTIDDAIRQMLPSVPKPRLAPLWVPKPEPIEGEAALGPQPDRRLAGVLWGNEVSAILETNGVADVVRPGSIIDRGRSRVRVESIEPTTITLSTLDTPKPVLIKVNLSGAVSKPPPPAAAAPGAPARPGAIPGPMMIAPDDDKDK